MIASATIIVVIVALSTTLIFLSLHRNTAPAENNSPAVTTVTNSAPGGNGSSTASAAPSAAAAAGRGKNIPALPGPAITINLITPISGNAWTIGGANPIVWSAAANITGEIELVNADTKAFIGVILSETGPNQTSYSWDARSVYLSRYGADKKDVVPGTYSIRIHFDGNGLGDLVSGPITITN